MLNSVSVTTGTLVFIRIPKKADLWEKKVKDRLVQMKINFHLHGCLTPNGLGSTLVNCCGDRHCEN